QRERRLDRLVACEREEEAQEEAEEQEPPLRRRVSALAGGHEGCSPGRRATLTGPSFGCSRCDGGSSGGAAEGAAAAASGADGDADADGDGEDGDDDGAMAVDTGVANGAAEAP